MFPLPEIIVQNPVAGTMGTLPVSVADVSGKHIS
jgi:hypothetical protein